METEEIWKPFPNTTNYFVSNLGRVKVIKSKKYPRGIIKDNDTLYKDRDGYPHISYKDINGKSKGSSVHRLVAKAFIPNADSSKTCVNHIDGNRANNKVSNLEWVTPKENVYHSFQYGKRKECKNVPRVTKLTDYQISQIDFLRNHYTLKKIADLFNISYTSIKNIVIKGKRLSQDNQQPSIYGKDYHDEGSTTIPIGSTLQAIGSGNALHSMSEDIV